MMKDSILILAAYGGPYEGNLIPSLRMLSKALAEQGIGTVMILQSKVKNYEWPKKLDWCQEVLFIDDIIQKDVFPVANLMRRYRFCFAHTHFSESKHIAILKLAMLLSGQHFPIVEHHHAQFPTPANPLKRFIKFRLMGGDYILGCGQSVAEGIRRSGLKNDITFVDNGLDFNRLGTCKERTPGRNLLMFGYDTHIKGTDIAIAACQMLLQEYPDLKLRVCVAVNMEKAKADVLSLLGEIPSWLELAGPTADIARYYEKANVFLSPSRTEGLCYSVIEAAYCGCTVIGSQIPGIQGVKIPHMVLVPPENPKALANAIRDMFNLPEAQHDELIQSLHQEAVDNYRLERWTEEMLAYFRSRKLIA